MSAEKKEHQTLHCDRCKDWLRLEFKNFDKMVDGVHIIVPELGLLICPSCGEEYFPDRTKALIRWFVTNSKRNRAVRVKGNRNSEPSQDRYDFCKEVNFKYDALDCEYIPGLQSVFTKDGYFTPVFFERKVLHKYQNFDEYYIQMAGNTYGTIYHNNWALSFGINRNGKVFSWLGKLEEIPQNELQYLASYNIDSDHDVASEYYLATREAEFGDRSNESKLLKARSEFEKLCESEWGFKVFHYKRNDDETLGKLVRPVNWNERGVTYVINYLTKLCVEAINTDSLRDEIKNVDPSLRTEDLKGLKLLEKWLQLRLHNLDAHDIMTPFFVLYDFRVFLDHEMSDERAEKMMSSCYDRLDIGSDRNFEKLYDKIVENITKSYSTVITNLTSIAKQE